MAKALNAARRQENPVRRLTILAVVVASLCGSLFFAASPAGAATTVSQRVVVTTTQCPRGGSVGRVNVSITNPGLRGSTGSSSGSSVSGLKTWKGFRATIQGTNFCKTSWYGAGYYNQWSVYRYTNGGTTYV